jgi:hypothetical protein
LLIVALFPPVAKFAVSTNPLPAVETANTSPPPKRWSSFNRVFASDVKVPPAALAGEFEVL